MRKPKALRPGDLLGLIAPSSGLQDPAQVDAAVAMLEGHGFRVQVGASCRASCGYLAGPDALRAGDLNRCLADPSIRGIVCLRGGYGTPRILDAVDYALAAADPKILVGYSDITGLHLALNRRAGLATFHGPMGVSDTLLEAEPFSTGSWLRALTLAEPLGVLAAPPGVPAARPLVGGRARGILAGGNLSLVAATFGTPYGLEPEGRILFFEDIDERPYRVDRMLTQLRLAGAFEACAGVVLGDWNHCVPDEGERSQELEEVFRDVLSSAGKPVLTGFHAGHCSPNPTFPFGVEAVLDADAGTLELVEAALQAP
jgi:muramoyltetrapeptide carboxypeptidase